MLHDDGVRLWEVALDGRKRLIWRHPRAQVFEIAVAPDLRTIAATVLASPPPTADRRDSAYLYVLEPDGSIATVDRVQHAGVLSSPIFLRAPSEQDSQGNPTGRVRLYWIRDYGEARSADRLPLRQVMVLLDRPTAVHVALRPGEWPGSIAGYPGSSVFSISVFRQDNLPTRYEILRSADYVRSPQERTTRWVQTRSIANTDMPNGVAWLTPHTYVVPVAQRFFLGQYSLRLYTVGCEYYGSHIAYRGTHIDLGYGSGTAWPLLPAGHGQVLVLTAADVQRVRSHARPAVPWSTLNVRNGSLRHSRAMWSPTGWWTYVPRPMSPTIELPTPAGCHRLRLSPP